MFKQKLMCTSLAATVALLVMPGHTNAAVESDWTFFAETGNWYKAVGGPVLGDGHVSWVEANADAISRGAWLVDIHTATENAFVQNLALTNDPDHGHWIGLFQPAGSPEPNGGWEWTSGAPVTYTNWGGGEPNDNGGSEDHAMLIGNNPSFAPDKWNDYNGSLSGSFQWKGGYVLESTVPEPASLVLLVVGGGLGLVRRRMVG
jgi:lectin-like protein/PEP-CTERM motif-containing protein